MARHTGIRAERHSGRSLRPFACGDHRPRHPGRDDVGIARCGDLPWLPVRPGPDGRDGAGTVPYAGSDAWKGTVSERV
jgi:hypothetical protein